MEVEFSKSRHKCIACNSFQFIQFQKVTRKITLRNDQSIDFKQTLECCYKCGLIRQEDNESFSDKNLAKYYVESFRTPIKFSELRDDDKRIRNAEMRLEFIANIKSNGNLLEVGFGDGVFLNLASRKYICTGLDPSFGYRYLHEDLRNSGVEVLVKPLQEYSSKKKFDVVCSFLVLEHVKDPITFIHLQLKYLAKNGILVIEVPDIRRYANFNSDSVFTFEHLYHYCIESLTLMLRQLDLALISNEQKMVSYGFSLIAAFKLSKEKSPRKYISGFSVIKMIQEFYGVRDLYKFRMSKALREIISTAQNKKEILAIYGAGYLFEYAVRNCEFDLNYILVLFDDTADKFGKIIFGKPVVPLFDFEKYNPDVVVIFSEMFFEIMKANLMNRVRNRNVSIINIHKLSS